MWTDLCLCPLTIGQQLLPETDREAMEWCKLDAATSSPHQQDKAATALCQASADAAVPLEKAEAPCMSTGSQRAAPAGTRKHGSPSDRALTRDNTSWLLGIKCQTARRKRDGNVHALLKHWPCNWLERLATSACSQRASDHCVHNRAVVLL